MTELPERVMLLREKRVEASLGRCGAAAPARGVRSALCRTLSGAFRDALTRAKGWHVFIGRNPKGVPPRSIIIFPLLRAVLPCGFAGLLAINGAPAAGEGLADSLRGLFTRLQAADMAALLAGSLPETAYLGGEDVIGGMEAEVAALKDQVAFQRFFFDAAAVGQLTHLAAEMGDFIAAEEERREAHAGRFSTGAQEIVNGRLVRLKDLQWALEKDILENVPRIAALAAGPPAPAAFSKYGAMNFLLNCLDRLEVRGRDSAGIQLSFAVEGAQLVDDVIQKLTDNGLAGEFAARSQACDLGCGTIHIAPCGPARGGLSVTFTYKTSSIVGELGQNVKNLRRAIADDAILREFSRLPARWESSFAHTRWASVGSITEENCHPINNFTLEGHTRRGGDCRRAHYPRYGEGDWTISAMLNGDIDNYQDLRSAREGTDALIAPEVTTDTKIIPLQIERYLAAGCDLAEAFRLSVNDFEGSHAIAMASNLEPGKFFLALKGSGQSIYIGIAPDRYLFSSELYGLVEGTPYFLTMDGSEPTGNGIGTAGQVFILDQDSPGGIAGITACSYDGTPITLAPQAVRRAEITTRDIDRGAYPHYFLKEITQSALSVKKTLRGRYRIEGEGEATRVAFTLGEDVIPERIGQALRAGRIRDIVVIGHGTAAVAGMVVAEAFARYLKDAPVHAEAKVASELSGFSLREDLRDTLVIPITQSGTTTDTNRAVSMAAERGASVIAVVNRRQSDITSKAHGVFYTSDGRDIEMSVASTKAFYSQIVAGHVLALCIAQLLGVLPDAAIAAELRILEQAPALMERVLERKEEIRQSVALLAKEKRYWAVVGSGPNKAAADEIRIKLSELCYKTISSDIVENKKHIDLSAEPLIIVCAAGNPEAVVGDIVKDAAIFKAHRAGVIVFAEENEHRFDGIADAVIGIPRAPWPLPVILNTVAGHLWGYYAALAIDEDAFFLRQFRDRLSAAVVEQRKGNISFYEGMADRQFRRLLREFTTAFNQRRNAGGFSFVGVKTMADLVLLLKYVAGKLPLEDYWRDFRGAGEQFSPVDLLDVTLGHAVDELSRPVDAIRHQAKTVTVGTSRKETPLAGVLFDLLWQMGFAAKDLASRNIAAIGRIQPALVRINGVTLYVIGNLDAEGMPQDSSTIAITKRTGVSERIRSRTESSPLLMGTKKTIARTGSLYVGQGKADGAPLVIVPLLGEAGGVGSLLLCHVDFREDLPLAEKKSILGERCNDIRNLVNEYNLPWNDRYLAEIPLLSLLGEPVEVIVGQIRQLQPTTGKHA
jgi:glutamine---fructose-6-phosphate transaminase (isomerizing)